MEGCTPIRQLGLPFSPAHMSWVWACPCSLACLRENLSCGQCLRQRNILTAAWILTAALRRVLFLSCSMYWKSSSLGGEGRGGEGGEGRRGEGRRGGGGGEERGRQAGS